VQSFTALSFVPQTARSLSKPTEKASSSVVMGAEKTLFEKTKKLNKELQESEKVLLVNTDELWAIRALQKDPECSGECLRIDKYVHGGKVFWR